MEMARPGVQNTDQVTCLVCDGHLESQRVNVCACETLPAVIVRNVPALVCVRCGEKVLSQAVMDTFARIGNGEAPPPAYEVSRVYDFDSVTDFRYPRFHAMWQNQAFGDFVLGTNYAEETSTNIRISSPAGI